MLYDLYSVEDFEDSTYHPDFKIYVGDFVRVNTQSNGGSYSFSNVDINDNGLAYFTVKFTVPSVTGATWNAATIGFDYKTSTELSYDLFKVYLDGSNVVTYSGSSVWRNYTSSNLSVGDHYLVFEYKKDVVYSAGSDAVFIDNLTLHLNYTV